MGLLFSALLFSQVQSLLHFCVLKIYLLSFFTQIPYLLIPPQIESATNKERLEVRAAQQLFATSGPHSL